MPEWFADYAVGHTRLTLLDGETVLATRLLLDEETIAGEHLRVNLIHKSKGSNRGTARHRSGLEVLVDKIPAGITEGAEFEVEITRAAIPESKRYKMAQGRVSSGEPPRPLQSVKNTAGTAGPHYKLQEETWREILQTAADGSVAFDGGELVFSVTPAMTLIDIDGTLPPKELALAAISPIARWLRLFDIGGSIGIDFPTLSSKADRKLIDQELAKALSNWPHECTAMNGFGFVQLVAKLEGPSLLHRFAYDRARMGMVTVMLQAVMVQDPGALLLTVHPAVNAKISEKHIHELGWETGRQIRIETDPKLALEGGFAQAVPL